MRKNRIYAMLVAVGALTVLAGCQKQGDESIASPETETVNVRFNTFLKEGDSIRPFNLNTRVTAGEGTLSNGFYLYGHTHNLPFKTSASNAYTPIFENVAINADGTYAIPKFWLQDKSRLYSFQAFASTEERGFNAGSGTITIASGVPYVSSSMTDILWTTDILGAAVYDIKIGDEVPTVNLYFEHRLCKLSLRMQRMNAGGPTLYNLRMATTASSTYWYMRTSRLDWAPGGIITANTSSYIGNYSSTPITLPAAEMSPIEAHRFIIPPQTLPAGLKLTLYYTLEPGAVSATNPELSLSTIVPAMKLESGKQLNVVVGHIVETNQIVVQSVTLTPWVTAEKDVPEYGGYVPDGCFNAPLGGDFPNTYVALLDDVPTHWAAANTACTKWGGRLPVEKELKTMYANKLKYGTFANVLFHWSGPAATYPFVKNMATGAENFGSNGTEKVYGVRCVKDAK